jgi:hypothetical protein
MNSYIKRIIIIAVSPFFIFNLASAKETTVGNKNPYPISYRSDIDKLLNLRSVVIVPVYDNVGGVYKTAAEKRLNELIVDDHFWSLVELKLPANKNGTQFRADWFEEKPDFTQQVMANSQADSLLSAIITKSSSGLTVNLVLYIKDGSPLISVSYQDEKTFEISKVNNIITDLYIKLKKKLPYNGLIMSRTGNLVTINLGQKNGLKQNDKLSVAQILAIKRHPKLKFMTGVEKEVIGQIILTKVDTDLSFAQISFEKEIGVIEKGSKLLPVNFVEYGEQTASTSPVLENEKDAQEWVPAPAPQYGKVSVGIGVTDYKISAMNKAGTNDYSSSQNLAPTLKLGMELWITSEWFASLDLEQSFFKASNGLSGSTPDSLSFTHSRYDLVFGYKYAVSGNFWGPQLSIGAGFLMGSTQVSDSNPVAYTSNSMNAWQIHLGGYFPISEDNKTAFGAKAKFVLFETFKESPVDSGKGDATINNFGIYFTHQISTNLQFKPEMNYGMNSVSYSGTGSNTNPIRSSEEKSVSYLFGVEYLF